MQELLPQDLRYAKLVDRYSRYIDSPVLRLKFLNSALSVKPPDDRWKKLPLVGSLPDRAFIILELSKVLPLDQQAPLGIRLASLLYRVRYALYALSLAAAVLACGGMLYGISRIVSSMSVQTQAKDILASNQTTAGAKEGEAVAAIGSGAGLSLDKIWLAEKGDGFEF